MSRQPWHWTEWFIAGLGASLFVAGALLRVRYG